MIDPTNKQGFANGPLLESNVDSDWKESVDVLYNAKDPNLGILSESPRHRMVIYLKAQGLANRKIAHRMGYTDAWVSQILRQPWARLRLLEELRIGGREGVQGILQAEAEESVYTLIGLRDAAEDEGVRLRASQDLLDRYLGKATQRVETKSEASITYEDITGIEREIKETEREINRIAGVSAVSVQGISDPVSPSDHLEDGQTKTLGA